MNVPASHDALAERPLLVGMVHLPPLPGAPGWAPGTDFVERAIRDARTLAHAGFRAVLVENFGDAPFFKRRVPPETVAALARAVTGVREALPPEVAVGVNVLRNDGPAALGIAAACELDFVRVNVLTGAALTDQGLIEGEAAELLRARARLRPEVRILADVRVKHAAPLAPRPLEEEVSDLVTRGGADFVVASGASTGSSTDLGHLRAVKDAAGATPLLVGSGATAEDIGTLLEHADGAIVGTALKQGGPSEAVDAERAARFLAAARP